MEIPNHLGETTEITDAPNFFMNFSHVQVSLATFATYTLINLNNPDQRLTAEKAFVSLSIFNIIHGPLSDLSDLIPRLVEVCEDQETDDRLLHLVSI